MIWTHDVHDRRSPPAGVRQPDAQLGAVVGQGGPELAHHGARELRQVHRLVMELERARIQTREVEQVHRELLETGHLLAHRVEELAPGLLVEVLVLEQLHETAQGEDRSAELVQTRWR